MWQSGVIQSDIKDENGKNLSKQQQSHIEKLKTAWKLNDINVRDDLREVKKTTQTKRQETKDRKHEQDQ